MDFVTDLNHRERAGIQSELRAHIEAAEKMAVALEVGDDSTLMIEFVIGSLSWHSLDTKIKPALLDAAKVMKAKSDIDGFRGF